MKNKKYHTVGTVLKLRRQIVERGTIDIPDTQIYDANFPGLVLALELKEWS
jgi:hypothetical protein